jgi:hypothetical protein
METRWIKVRILALGLAAGTLLAAPVLAASDKDCDRPLPPKIPDGKTASDVEMISATQRTKLYMESAQTFLDCLDAAEQSVTETAREVKLKRIQKKRTEMAEERDTTLEKFNAQVRIYKERTGAAAEPTDPAAPATPSAPAR